MEHPKEISQSNCPACHCRRNYPWANLQAPFPQVYRVESLDKWTASADEGDCSLCRLGLAVTRDAAERYKIMQDRFALSTILDMETEGTIQITFQVNCGPDSMIVSQFRIVVFAQDWAVFSFNHTDYKLAGYKPILTTNATSSCIDQARHWLSTCASSHETCGSGLTPLPTRIVDVSTSPPRLFITGGTPGIFVALSHCWGSPADGSGPLKTTRDSIDTHVQAIREETLPKNFQDAIAVTRALDFQYIWIDSLCIIQDDGDDWNREAVQMKSVYENAALVLAASSSANVSTGFLRERTPYQEGTLSSESLGIPGSGAFTYRVIPNHDGWEPSNQGPLDTRAWCFQERLMARRYLSFGTHEMVWECRVGARCECDFKPVWWDQDTKTHQRNTQAYNITNLIAQGMKGTEHTPFYIYWLWAIAVVRMYTRRGLTYPSDKLVAMTAVTERYREVLKDELLWGLWRGDFLTSLCWFTQKLGSMGDPYLPTWSWASITANISGNRGAHFAGAKQMAQVLEYPKPQTGSGVESMGDGAFTIGGPMVDAYLTVDKQGHLGLDLGTDCGELNLWLDVPIYQDLITREGVEVSVTQRARGASAQSPGRFAVCMLSLFQRSGSLSPFLILGRSSGGPDRFQRIGLGTAVAGESGVGFFGEWVAGRATLV